MGDTDLGQWFTAKEFDEKLLLIYCSRGQESILDTFPKPVWSLRACIAYIIDTLGLMLNTGGLAITYGNVTTDLFVRLERIRSENFAVTDAGPT